MKPLEQIPYAEEQGFESVWFSEPHFRPVWSHNSAPDLTLAAVSQRTSRIRLEGGGVSVRDHGRRSKKKLTLDPPTTSAAAGQSPSAAILPTNSPKSLASRKFL
jgi:hypothetical protein